MIDININALDFSTCVVLKLGNIYDFRIYMRNRTTDMCWRGCCQRVDLQACVALGMAKLR